jgi:alpha-tubulin suppressor-like RCC1 family protein
LNQYKDQKELKEISSPINRVALFGLNNRATQVSCGDSFTLVLNEKHQLFSFGKSSHGRLGIGNPNLKDQDITGNGNGNIAGDCINEPEKVEAVKNEKVVQISAGCRHSACITGNFN